MSVFEGELSSGKCSPGSGLELSTIDGVSGTGYAFCGCLIIVLSSIATVSLFAFLADFLVGFTKALDSFTFIETDL